MYVVAILWAVAPDTVSGGIELEAAAVFGAVTVAVPAGWDLATETISIVDRATDNSEHSSSRKATPELVVCGGAAILGDVIVTA